jgi:hypothetical protein
MATRHQRVKQKLDTLNLEGDKFRGNMENLEGLFQGGGRQTHSEKGKEKQTHLDIPRHAEDGGDQAKNENRRKVGRR